MIIARTKQALREQIKRFRVNYPEASIGFVPTMGYLHEGHLSLVKKAREENDLVVVSIFVNPTQFSPTEDYAEYPRDESRDIALCKNTGVDIVFIPSAEEMYPPDFQTHVHVEKLTRPLCGAYRKGHFQGVTTIVAKLFHLVEPHRAYFGLKDGQQAIVIRKMIKDLDFNIELRALPTIREPDGLAMSSRNVNLSPDARKKAPVIYKALSSARNAVEKGAINVQQIVSDVRRIIETVPEISIQYLECRDLKTLEPIEEIHSPAILAVAAYLDSVRLIDNVILMPPGGSNET